MDELSREDIDKTRPFFYVLVILFLAGTVLLLALPRLISSFPLSAEEQELRLTIAGWVELQSKHSIEVDILKAMQEHSTDAADPEPGPVSFVKDVDGDGKDDTITRGQNQVMIETTALDSPLVIDYGKRLVRTAFNERGGVGFNDVDGDGNQDAWWSDSERVAVLWGDGKGRFATGQYLGQVYGSQFAFYWFGEDRLPHLMMMDENGKFLGAVLARITKSER
ncbi:VCBS repeat-containing protein [bacterium]|nr:VCBS repeat-containing protein [bacterium]